MDLNSGDPYASVWYADAKPLTSHWDHVEPLSTEPPERHLKYSLLQGLCMTHKPPPPYAGGRSLGKTRVRHDHQTLQTSPARKRIEYMYALLCCRLTRITSKILRGFGTCL